MGEAIAERGPALQSAALKPKVFRKLWDEFGPPWGVSSNALISFLTDDQKIGAAVFNRKAARTALSLYYANLEYAGLNEAPLGISSVAGRPVAGSLGSGAETSVPPVRGGTGWVDEQFPDDDGNLIFIRYRGPPSRKIYECIRDQFEFGLQRLKRENHE